MLLVHSTKRRIGRYSFMDTTSRWWCATILSLTVAKCRIGNSQCMAMAMAKGSTSLASHGGGGGVPFPPILPASDKIKTLVEFDSSAANADGGSPTVRAVWTSMNYVTPDTGEVHVRRDPTGCDSTIDGATWHPVDVPIGNARLLSTDSEPILDHNGFELVTNGESSSCTYSLPPPVRKDLDFLDTPSVIDEYYPHCERLLQSVLNGNGKDRTRQQKVLVKAFDHNIRMSSTNYGGDELKGGGGSKGSNSTGSCSW